ncbi:unnamed protein product [Lampetra fluviatilis]
MPSGKQHPRCPPAHAAARTPVRQRPPWVSATQPTRRLGYPQVTARLTRQSEAGTLGTAHLNSDRGGREPVCVCASRRIEALFPDRGEIDGTVRCEATRISVEADN